MTLYCGIDLHSNNSQIALIDEADQVIKEKRLPNDMNTINDYLAPYQDDLAGVVVESTYNWYWLVDGLMESGYPVHLANTLAIHQYSGIKYTNDATDARYLAQLLSLQSLIGRHTGERLSGLKTKQLDTEALEKYFSTPATLFSARQSHALIGQLTEQIDSVEAFVLAQCVDDARYRQLNSIPGVGKILGMTILLETGPIERFREVGHYASYARCVPTDKISNGKSKGKGNRNNGNKYLGMAFVEAAHYAAIWSPEIKRFYQRRCKKRPVMVAKKTVANKLTRACYHMLSNNTLFDVKRAFG